MPVKGSYMLKDCHCMCVIITSINEEFAGATFTFKTNTLASRLSGSGRVYSFGKYEYSTPTFFFFSSKMSGIPPRFCQLSTENNRSLPQGVQQLTRRAVPVRGKLAAPVGCMMMFRCSTEMLINCWYLQVESISDEANILGFCIIIIHVKMGGF